MQGEIKVNSTPGQGSVFTVQLTLPPCPEWVREGWPIQSNHCALCQTTEDTLELRRLDEGSEHACPVLIVEDNAINSRILGRMLEMAGFTNIEYTHNGCEALEHLQHARVKILLTDLHMPEMDGLELVQHVRRQYPDWEMIIIGITADAFDDTVSVCMQAGMDDVLTKPLTRQKLIDSIDRLYFQRKDLARKGLSPKNRQMPSTM
ncbi:MAG: response regulator [Leptospiraceae bacterium]|nr:response regulator [Leptospiraceae bacterium]